MKQRLQQEEDERIAEETKRKFELERESRLRDIKLKIEKTKQEEKLKKLMQDQERA